MCAVHAPDFPHHRKATETKKNEQTGGSKSRKALRHGEPQHIRAGRGREGRNLTFYSNGAACWHTHTSLPFFRCRSARHPPAPQETPKSNPTFLGAAGWDETVPLKEREESLRATKSYRCALSSVCGSYFVFFALNCFFFFGGRFVSFDEHARTPPQKS